YYAKARKRAEEEKERDAVEPETRIMSRLGDAYEALGDVPAAVATFDHFNGPRAQGKDEDMDLALQIIDLRSKLKGAFYSKLLKLKMHQSTDAFNLVNAYVDILQLRGCPDDAERVRIEQLIDFSKHEEWSAFKALMVQHYEALRAGIVEFDAESDLGAL